MRTTALALALSSSLVLASPVIPGRGSGNGKKISRPSSAVSSISTVPSVPIVSSASVPVPTVASSKPVLSVSTLTTIPTVSTIVTIPSVSLTSKPVTSSTTTVPTVPVSGSSSTVRGLPSSTITTFPDTTPSVLTTSSSLPVSSSISAPASSGVNFSIPPARDFTVTPFANSALASGKLKARATTSVAASSKPASSAAATSKAASSTPASSAASTSKAASSAPASSAPASSAPASSAPATTANATSSAPTSTPTSSEGASSCNVLDLTADTWTKLNIDKFLVDWVAANVTAKQSNNVQDLSATFGAPNFFCGIDNFCNAGQPCLPVQPPAWYALLAIQNWNSYMNNVNTAINFASSIMGLYLPGLVQDLYPKPQDDITPMKEFYKMFSTVLGMVPFVGNVQTAATAVSKGINFVADQLTPPDPADKFATWSNVAGQLSTVVQDYQGTVSTNFKKMLDVPVNGTDGILSILNGGNFIGTSQNFTQNDLQTAVIDSLKKYSAGLVLRAQGIQLSVANNNNNNGGGCTGKDTKIGFSSLCVDNGPTNWTMSTLTDKDFYPQDDLMETLVNKYGFTREEVNIDSLKCDPNKDYFNTSLPLDSKTPCLFYLSAPGINAPSTTSSKRAALDFEEYVDALVSRTLKGLM